MTRVISMYNNGHPMKVIANRHGVPVADVRSYLRARGYVLVGSDAGELYSRGDVKSDHKDHPIPPDRITELMINWAYASPSNEI